MVLDLHLSEAWYMGADPLEELGTSQIPIFNPMTLFWEFRDMLVTVSIVVKASATAGRDSRQEAVARGKSSA